MQTRYMTIKCSILLNRREHLEQGKLPRAPFLPGVVEASSAACSILSFLSFRIFCQIGLLLQFKPPSLQALQLSAVRFLTHGSPDCSHPSHLATQCPVK